MGYRSFIQQRFTQQGIKDISNRYWATAPKVAEVLDHIASGSVGGAVKRIEAGSNNNGFFEWVVVATEPYDYVRYLQLFLVKRLLHIYLELQGLRNVLILRTSQTSPCSLFGIFLAAAIAGVLGHINPIAGFAVLPKLAFGYISATEVDLTNTKAMKHLMERKILRVDQEGRLIMEF